MTRPERDDCDGGGGGVGGGDDDDDTTAGEIRSAVVRAAPDPTIPVIAAVRVRKSLRVGEL